MLYTPRVPHFVSTPQGRTLLSYVTGDDSLSSKTPCLHDLFRVSRSIGARRLLGWPNSPAALTASLWAFDGTLWLRKRQQEAPVSRERPCSVYLSVMFSSAIMSRKKTPFWVQKGIPWKLRWWQFKHLWLEHLTKVFIRLNVTTVSCKSNKLRETLSSHLQCQANHD